MPAVTETGRGLLIVNADDWGRDVETTDRILECVQAGSVSSVSAMVFMEDSERAAAISCSDHIEAGLHLNLTTRFSAHACPSNLAARQQTLSSYLRRGRIAAISIHPGLVRTFEYVVRCQVDEFHRLYGSAPERIDGHHHAHLCANMLAQRLLPSGTLVRRNFSFQAGEKSVWNRLYRGFIDRRLSRRHRVTDFFFSLSPLQPSSRLERIFALAQSAVVEVETHPAQPDEYQFLRSREIFKHVDAAIITPPSVFLARCATLA